MLLVALLQNVNIGKASLKVCGLMIICFFNKETLKPAIEHLEVPYLQCHLECCVYLDTNLSYTLPNSLTCTIFLSIVITLGIFFSFSKQWVFLSVFFWVIASYFGTINMSQSFHDIKYLYSAK